MATPKHLLPQTYWEARCELLENAVEQLKQVMADHGSQQMIHSLGVHADNWDRLQRELIAKFPEKGGA